MPESATDSRAAHSFAGSLIVLGARRRELPECPTTTDLLLVGIATHKLSRLTPRTR
jgi:hypothetical protein